MAQIVPKERFFQNMTQIDLIYLKYPKALQNFKKISEPNPGD